MEECPRCGEFKHPDGYCPNCGFYGSELDYEE